MTERDFSKLCRECFKIETSRKSNISIKDAGSSSQTNYILHNDVNAVVCELRIDDKLIVGNKLQKCDNSFLFNNAQKNYCILVEFKGSDIFQAMDQIDSTLRYLIEILKINDKFKPRYFFRIVCSKAEKETKVLCDFINGKKIDKKVGAISKFKKYRQTMKLANMSFDTPSNNLIIKTAKLEEHISNMIKTS